MSIESCSTASATTLRTYRALGPCLGSLAAAVVLAVPSPAFAGLLASATISTTSTSAPYNYTITLDNLGTTNIGTFWFAWTDIPINYDLLPSSPTVTSMPAGWIAPISHNSAFPGDGYGIEFYNYLGSSIAPGTIGTFKFTSADSPTTVAGNAFISSDKVATSFVYVGFPQGDPGFQFNAKVAPEPSSAALAGVGVGTVFLTWLIHRRRMSASC
jgi:hypothetical protein